MGEKSREKGRENPLTEKILLFKWSGQLNEATLASSLRWGSGFLHAPFHPKLPGVMQVFVYLWGRKRGLSDTKGKKMHRMEGIKGVKLPWCFECLQLCKLGLGQCRGCWMERNNCKENGSAMWAASAVILLTKVLTATYMHETLLTNPWVPLKKIFSEHFRRICIKGQITPCPCWMLGEEETRKLEASHASHFYIISFALTLLSLHSIILIFSGASHVLREAFLKGHWWALRWLWGSSEHWWVVAQLCFRRVVVTGCDHAESKKPYCNKGGEKKCQLGTCGIFGYF